MPHADIPPSRIRPLNACAAAFGDYVLYCAPRLRVPVFHFAKHVIDDYPEANERHYGFMLEGLHETQAALAERGIGMSVERGAPAEVALRLGRRAAMIVCDCGYLRHQRQWREQVAAGTACAVIEVESDVVVPVETASDKAEIGARILRPRLHRQLDAHLLPLRARRVKTPSLELRGGLELDNPIAPCRRLKLDRSVPATR